jgi:hypothetical protein
VHDTHQTVRNNRTSTKFNIFNKNYKSPAIRNLFFRREYYDMNKASNIRKLIDFILSVEQLQGKKGVFAGFCLFFILEI